MSRLIWICAVCKNLLLSLVALKEVKVEGLKFSYRIHFAQRHVFAKFLYVLITIFRPNFLCRHGFLLFADFKNMNILMFSIEKRPENYAVKSID